MSNLPGIYKDWTVPQAMHVLKLICDKALNVPQAEQLGLYLPPLLEAINKGKLPNLRAFKKALGLGILATVTPHISLEGDTTFRVGSRFVKNTNTDAEVPISFLGSNWIDWFSNTEIPATEACDLEVSELTEGARDELIIAEVGDDVCETSPAVLWLMMKDGHLSKDTWYLFYMKDKSGVRRAVCVGWYDGGWRVNANPVPYPCDWGRGRHVVSRKRLTAQV